MKKLTFNIGDAILSVIAFIAFCFGVAVGAIILLLFIALIPLWLVLMPICYLRGMPFTLTIDRGKVIEKKTFRFGQPTITTFERKKK